LSVGTATFRADFAGCALGIGQLKLERPLAEDSLMKSPFPGMDPDLERHWGDVHQRIVTYACDRLQSRLPEDLRARMQERVYIEIPDVGRGEYYADVRS
jgi:Protein of unknown function (DUF4058)